MKNRPTRSMRRHERIFARGRTLLEPPIFPRKCAHCHEMRGVGDFYKCKSRLDGTQPWCKICLKKNLIEWRASPAGKDKNLRWEKSRRKLKPFEQTEKSRRYRAKIRAEFISEYGGRCACCEEDIPEFLTLEHINGDGKAHRKQTGGGLLCLLDLKRKGWPKDDYKLLCMNCNFVTRYGQPCPHASVPMGLGLCGS